MNQAQKKIAIIGGGASGIMSALRLLEKGHSVTLFEYKANIARKFLVAGHGGLNLTHSEDINTFCEKYYKDKELFKNLLNHFSPSDYRAWLSSIGVETFKGTSSRIFPKDKTAKDIVKIFQENLNKYDRFSLQKNSKLIDIDRTGKFTILQNKEEIRYTDHNFVILALGGASWAKTGSDANWTDIIAAHNIEIIPFSPMNCGYIYEWSDYLKDADTQIVLKNIALKVGKHSIRGEALITSYGIEGSGIYALNYFLKSNKCLEIDLKPDLTFEKVKEKLESMPAKSSLTNYLRKSLSINSKVFSLLREKLTPTQIKDTSILAQTIKSFKIELKGPRPIEEAISSSGGISLNEVDKDFKLKKIENTFAIGEMLDWEAPTGGYLLQGCFSMADYICSKIK